MADERDEFVRASWANVVGNVAKIIVEGAAGIAFGSVALIADAAHSVADLVASAVVLIWGPSSFDEPDRTHPHGHARIEPLTALFVGSVIVLLGVNLLYESARGILYGVTVEFSWILLGALAFAIVDMYLVYWYTTRVNESIGSTGLTALATDCLNDIYTSVAVAVGVFGVLLGVPLMDPIAGGLVSLLVVYQGVQIARENVDYLVGKAPPEAKVEEILSVVRSHPAVHGVHDPSIYYEGTEIEVELHVEVDGSLTLLEAHEIESDVADRLRSVEEVGDVHVHLDPSGIGEWKDADEYDGPIV